MKTAKKALTVILSVILWIIILLAALYAFTTLATRDSQNVSSVAGFTPLSVESDSMSPTFNAGDLIIIRRCDTSALQVGDIITFHTLIENQYALNTHRIAEIEEVYGLRSYTTKGDNNAIADTRFVSDSDTPAYGHSYGLPVLIHGLPDRDRAADAPVLHLSGLSYHRGQHQS